MVNAPNKITFARILAIPIFIVLLYIEIQHNRIIAAIVFAVIAFTDVIDGWLARRRKQVSEGGAILDPLADKLLVSAALIFLINKGVEPWMAFVIIAREFIITGVRLLTTKITHARVLGKAKTISQYIAIVLVLIDFKYSWYAMLIAVILTVISGLDYLWHTRKEVKKATE